MYYNAIFPDGIGISDIETITNVIPSWVEFPEYPDWINGEIIRVDLAFNNIYPAIFKWQYKINFTT